MKQKIVTVVTLRPNLRAAIDSWGFEDGDLVQLDKQIGLTDSPKIRCWPTPLHYMGDGWRLMAPPVFIKDYAKEIDGWEWWFEKP